MNPTLSSSSGRPAVIKFGGSLLGSPALDRLLDVAARAGSLVAPGGGPFADAVRTAQDVLEFSDDAAHRMAILAMEQTALALADRARALIPCATDADFARADARASLWMPATMALAADVPRSWAVSSDSLALWLAIRLNACRLILLKSADIDPRSGPGDWVRNGWVDSYFLELAPRFPGAIACVGPADPAALEAALAAPLRDAA